MARLSALSSATRDQPSSPTKQPSDRQSQSPVGRRTRSTRSQSADLGESAMATTTRRGGKRGARQASVESLDSNTSAASSRGGRARKATRMAGQARDLSMVAEDREMEQNEDDEEEEEDGKEDQDVAQHHHSHSPGGMSQISGTTAISSFSARTSHSQGEIGALDPMVAEMLPDLWNDSYRIMNLLAPADAQEEQVESSVKELKVSGSRLAKNLRQSERRFALTREHFGNEPYIKTTLIFQRLLGTPNPSEAISRPDAIIHAANLATLVKDFLVMEKESQSSQSILGGLDSYFPQVFVAKFEDNIQAGNSRLLEESFELALDIRTQLTIIALGFQKEQESWDPEQILLDSFYDAPPQRSRSPISDFEDAIRNGRPRDLMGAGSTLADHRTAEVLQRVMDIRSTFRHNTDAIELGDLVDFERLEELFPWVKFLADLVYWSRMRLDEISEGIKQQGGVLNITQSFIEAIKFNDSQVDINYDAPPPSSVIAPRQLQPAAEILPAAFGQSFYNGDRNMVRKLEEYKSTSASHKPASKKQNPTVASSSAPRPNSKQQGASQARAPKTVQEANPQSFDNIRLDVDDGFDEQPRSAEEYAQVWTSYSNERNKENRPAPKRRLVDPQPGARQMRWIDSQETEAGPSTNKRKYQEPAEEENEEEGVDVEEEEEQREEAAEEEEVSEDEGFQQDHRVADPARRLAAPKARRQSPVRDAPSPPKRQTIEHSRNDSDREAARRRQQRAESATRASARREVVDEEEDEDEDAYPAPTFPQASVVARVNVAHAQSRTSREPQKRIPWSEEDTIRLMDAIEQFGCSWSLIAKNVDFDHPRDQVALKDKARNMRVTYLKAGIPLPLNLENVPLGRKEIEAVRRVFPAYEP